MKKQNTLISILIINYNNCSLLKRAIESSLKQSYKNIEILIFDDKSNDNSRSVLKKFIKNKKIKIFFNKNKKTNLAALDAANGYYLLFKKSKGKYVVRVDSDDFICNNFLSETIKHLKNKKISFVYSNYVLVDKKGKIIQVSNFFMNNKSYDFVQNLPVIVENKKKIYKKNSNNFLSYWPYFAPESCISFKRNFMLRFLKKNKYLNHKFADVWLGFRM